MKEHPILFSAPMVRAILDGQKTQTRRVVSEKFLQHTYDTAFNKITSLRGCPLTPFQKPGGKPGEMLTMGEKIHEVASSVCPYGAPGHRLWVKETFAPLCEIDGSGYPENRPFLKFPDPPPAGVKYYADYIIYRADGEAEFCDEDGGFLFRKDGSAGSLWKSSLFMPRWASRITLEITGIRVERLNEISEEDARAEGIECNEEIIPTEQLRISRYADLWESINGEGSWDLNPWVWVIEFKPITL